MTDPARGRDRAARSAAGVWDGRHRGGGRRGFLRCGVLAVLLAGARRAEAILGGTVDLDPHDSPERRVDPNTRTSPWSGVGSLTVSDAATGEPRGTYTAAAIDAFHVLTAAHVVHGRAPEQIRFNLNFGGDLTHRIAADTIHVHPDYAGFRPDPGTGLVHDDLAVVRLASSLPFGVALYRIYPQPLPLRTVVTLVGYGAAGDGVAGVTVPGHPGVKRVGRNVLDRVVRANGGRGAFEIYLFDFDGSDATTNRMGGLSLGNDVEASLAGGDSGSPALVPGPQGAWWIVGVNTFVGPRGAGQGRFGSIGGGTLLYGYLPWIESILGSAPAA
jgi:hypothetical protein